MKVRQLHVNLLLSGGENRPSPAKRRILKRVNFLQRGDSEDMVLKVCREAVICYTSTTNFRLQAS